MPRSALASAFVLALAPFLAGCGGCGCSDPVPVTLPAGWNLDFGNFYVVPDTFAGAALQDGAWIGCAPGTTTDIEDVEGVVTSVDVVLAGRFDSFNTPATDTGFLLADAMMSNTVLPPMETFTCTIQGLPAGTYDVYYYFYGATSGFTLNGTPMTDLTADGTANARDNLGAQGTNWNVARVAILTGGEVVITDTTPTETTGLSGLQIVPVTP
jgi:hypothetical protein